MTSGRVHASSRTALPVAPGRAAATPARVSVVVDHARTPPLVSARGRVGSADGPRLARLLGAALGASGRELLVDLSRLRLCSDDARAALRSVVLSRPVGPRVTLLADEPTIAPVRDLLDLQLAWCPLEVQRPRWRLERLGAHASPPTVDHRWARETPAA